jgi:hypothetical protein
MLVVHSGYIMHCMLSLLLILASDISSYHGFSLVIFFFVVVALLKLFFLFLDNVFTLCAIYGWLKWLMIIHGGRDASRVSDSMVLIHISFIDDLWYFCRKSCCKTRHYEIMSHFLLLSTSIFYNPVATSGWTETTHPSGVPDFSPQFSWTSCCSIFYCLFGVHVRWIICCSVVLCHLAIELSVVQFTASDCCIATSNLSYA